jgi:catalase
MTDQDHPVGNILDHLDNAQKRIQLRQTALFYKAHKEDGTRAAKGLSFDVKEINRLAGMSREQKAKATEK